MRAEAHSRPAIEPARHGHLIENMPYPTKLEQQGAKLVINFSNGTRREYTCRELRDTCPCADVPGDGEFSVGAGRAAADSIGGRSPTA